MRPLTNTKRTVFKFAKTGTWANMEASEYKPEIERLIREKVCYARCEAGLGPKAKSVLFLDGERGEEPKGAAVEIDE